MSVTVYYRNEELSEARTKISDLSEELDAAKQQTRRDYESSMKTLHREISEVPNGRNDSFCYIDVLFEEILCRYKIFHRELSRPVKSLIKKYPHLRLLLKDLRVKV